jgi:hypothetical protein
MVSYQDTQHLLKPRKVSTGRKKSRTGKGARSRTAKGKKFYKGSASKTHPGEKDFTTKKSSKYFDRAGHRSKRAEGSFIDRLPYHIEKMFGVKMTKRTKKASKGKAKRGKTARRSRKSRK